MVTSTCPHRLCGGFFSQFCPVLAMLGVAPWWWWKAQPVTNPVTETATMLIIGITLGIFGIGLFCWLIFTLTVYALPFFVGLTSGMAAFHAGLGAPGALLIGIVIGILTLGGGKLAFCLVKSVPLRAAIAAAFAIPAG